MKIAGIIPVRYNSSRLPGKPLADILGKPMILWVYERARQAEMLEEVFVATDDVRIKKVVEKEGGRVIMTSPSCRSGTDRIAEVAKTLEYDIFVNIQGDEPLISPDVINLVVKPFFKEANILVTTAATLIRKKSEIKDANVVKLVMDKFNFGLYFSRAPIPFVRDGKKSSMKPEYYKHLGIYAYRREFLLRFNLMPSCNLEKIEQLEQLRIINYGYKIKVVISNYDSISVDTPKDLERVRKIATQIMKDS